MTQSPFLRYARIVVCALLALPVVTVVRPTTLYAQSSATLTGTVLDPRGVPLPGAAVSVKNETTSDSVKKKSDSVGKYSFANLAAGKYTVQVAASGFNTSQRTGVTVVTGQATEVPVTLELGNVSEEITVEASEANSVAAAMAPMDALLGETSPRTEITQAFISDFTAPTADYGEIVAMAPGTFTTNGNGVGLGQSKTFFRGFPDGDYDIDFDGVPFYDTNSPTHHSWVFFPSQWIGGVDFDRSPGTASTTGPTPFGGSIHLLSRDRVAALHRRQLPHPQQLVGLRPTLHRNHCSAVQRLRLQPDGLGHEPQPAHRHRAQAAALHHLSVRHSGQAEAAHHGRGLLPHPLPEQLLLLHRPDHPHAELLPPARLDHQGL